MLTINIECDKCRALILDYLRELKKYEQDRYHEIRSRGCRNRRGMRIKFLKGMISDIKKGGQDGEI